jgi:8-oxo-dGTP diphosphatase
VARLYPDRPVVGVGGLVLDGGRILLVRRGYPPGRGRWSIPGGHVEVGETLYEAAVRETLEETGVEARPLGVVNVDDAITIDSRGVRYHYVLVTVLLQPVDPRAEPRPGGDAVEAAYYNMAEALERLDLTDSTRGLIYKILQGRIPLEKPIPVARYTPLD